MNAFHKKMHGKTHISALKPNGNKTKQNQAKQNQTKQNETNTKIKTITLCIVFHRC